MNEKAWKILFPPHSLSVESRALVSLWSDVWLGLRLFRFPHSSSYKTGYIHPSFTEQMIIRLLLKELLFLFGRQWRGLHFHFHEKPVLVLLISGPFFFSPISFAHHTDKSEWMRLQFFLFWVNHVQHVHTDERQNLRSIFFLAASNSLNWVWPARKSFANTSL